VTALPILGLLLALAEAATCWPGFRWASLTLSIAGQCLAAWAWWKARHQPVAVTYACPYRCGFIGDRLACHIHAERCEVARWAA